MKLNVHEFGFWKSLRQHTNAIASPFHSVEFHMFWGRCWRKSELVSAGGGGRGGGGTQQYPVNTEKQLDF